MGKNIISFLVFMICFVNNSKAQNIENFNDGNLLNPDWTGNTTDFIVNSSLEMQSNNTVASSSYYASLPNTLATEAQWEFTVKLQFNPSSANYVDIYLTASSSDLGVSSTTGYFVRIGNTDDEISLYRKNASGASVKIIDGADDVLNSSSHNLKLKVTRDASQNWMLFYDLSGTGNNYSNGGSVMDATYTTSAFFGFFIKQSTASFFQKHFFDDIEIKNYEPDIMPPQILSAAGVNNTTVDVLFNEPLQKPGSETPANYNANNGLGMPISAVADDNNSSLIHLTFGTALTNGTVYTLLVNEIKDMAGNTLTNGSISFSYYTPQAFDVVIDELIADATPQTGLPNREWLELKNTTSFSINLAGWSVSDGSGSSGLMETFILQPDSFVIISSSSAVADLSIFGNVLAVSSFPSLDNEAGIISLRDANGTVIHAVNYSNSWYENDLKKEGGWTLEMVDTQNPCSGAGNWKASTDPSGGTPGRKNSVDGVNMDTNGPQLLHAYMVSETVIALVFNEPLDRSIAAVTSNYSIDNGVSVLSAAPVSPLFNIVNITLDNPVVLEKIYQVTANNLTDCKGNAIGNKNHAKFGLAEDADSLDIVVNEILFNPVSPGVDYAELYNRSDKIIDLGKTFLANRNSSNEVSNIELISSEHLLLFPQEYILLSTNTATVKNQFTTTNPDAFIELSSFPSFSDDEGNVIVLNSQGKIIDEVAYSDDWHFALVSNPEGVSLERIDFDGPSTSENFHSAATSVGYGTPGYKNSQYRLTENTAGTIKVTPEIFSPDNDGTDDFITIDYSFSQPGYVTNITIFDASGRHVRYLQKNSLSGIKGYYRWDGLNDNGAKLPQGIYIIYTEIFNTDGEKKIFKNTVVLARRY